MRIFVPKCYNMIYITRRERFCAAHILRNDEWSDEKNKKIFGKCSNINWHGHNYELFVTIKGKINPKTGFLVNLKELRDLINLKIINKLDHKNLNLDVDFLKNKITSTENLTQAIWTELENDIKIMGASLHCVKVYETENNFVEYYGE